MAFQFENFLTFVAEYASALPSEMLSGNVFAVAMGLISVYIIVLLINKLTGLLIFLFKKIILAIIIILAFYQFLLLLNSRIIGNCYLRNPWFTCRNSCAFNGIICRVLIG